MTNSTLIFVYPGDLDTRTGGYRYDKRIITELQRAGWEVELVSLQGDYPFPEAAQIAAADAKLAEIPDGSLVVIDGLAYSVLPDILEKQAQRLTLVALIHHPLALETGLSGEQARQLKALETRALQYASHVITTSTLTAVSLADYDVAAANVTAVLPGTDLCDVAEGSQTDVMNMICVATLTPRKGHAVLLNSLAPLRHLQWHLTCAGSTDRDKITYAALLDQREQLGLNDRVSFAGELGDAALEECYHSADLFVLASYHEGYGMVLSEAIARALPIVCTDGGAMALTVPEGTGLLVPAGDTQALTGALREFLVNTSVQANLHAAALQARKKLRTWTEAADEFATLMKSIQCTPLS